MAFGASWGLPGRAIPCKGVGVGGLGSPAQGREFLALALGPARPLARGGPCCGGLGALGLRGPWPSPGAGVIGQGQACPARGPWFGGCLVGGGSKGPLVRGPRAAVGWGGVLPPPLVWHVWAGGPKPALGRPPPGLKTREKSRN